MSEQVAGLTTWPLYIPIWSGASPSSSQSRAAHLDAMDPVQFRNQSMACAPEYRHVFGQNQEFQARLSLYHPKGTVGD